MYACHRVDQSNTDVHDTLVGNYATRVTAVH